MNDEVPQTRLRPYKIHHPRAFELIMTNATPTQFREVIMEYMGSLKDELEDYRDIHLEMALKEAGYEVEWNTFFPIHTGVKK